MFLCVSPNPAIDKRLLVPSIVAGQIVRARSARAFAGGKSTHVAMVLRTLGETPHWIGLCGGSTGTELTLGLRKLGIEAHPSRTSSNTRTNLEIIDDLGNVTEILESGEAPTLAEVEEFENSGKELFLQGRERLAVIFSGSLPTGVPADLYERLVSSAGECGCSTFLDAGGESLRLALSAHPDLVKPNRDEAASLLGFAIDSLDIAARAVRQLIELGARRAALSLGADGLLYCAGIDAPVLFAPALSLRVRSTVGCGDSAMAGFARSIATNASPEDALRFAAACAAANCLAESPGAARAEDIERFLGAIPVDTVPSVR